MRFLEHAIWLLVAAFGLAMLAVAVGIGLSLEPFRHADDLRGPWSRTEDDDGSH